MLGVSREKAQKSQKRQRTQTSFAAPEVTGCCQRKQAASRGVFQIRIGFRALELGASSVYCSSSLWIIEAMAREGIPVVGHLGMVPRHVTWTNVRAIGKTTAEAQQLYQQMKRLESAGAYAAELELVPEKLGVFRKPAISWLSRTPHCRMRSERLKQAFH